MNSNISSVSDNRFQGGAVAAIVAIKRPDYLNGLILIAPGIIPDPATATPTMVGAFCCSVFHLLMFLWMSCLRTVARLGSVFSVIFLLFIGGRAVKTLICIVCSLPAFYWWPCCQIFDLCCLFSSCFLLVAVLSKL